VSQAGRGESTDPPRPDPDGPQEYPARHRGKRAGLLTFILKPAVLAVAVGLLLAACGITGFFMAAQPHPAPAAPPAKNVPVPLGPAIQTPSPQTTTVVSPPVSLAIPAIGVSTKLIHLGLTSTGALQVPGSTAVAGWYTGSPAPGAIGSAVIAGHVDSYQGPGVFYRLRLMRPGNQIYVRQADGKLAIFKVSTVKEYPKSGFPTDAVYGPTPTPTLRLITCGGTFDFSTGHYLSNIIVFATLSLPGHGGVTRT
jgi:sortase (surface protein transpeptidase)